ncbi:MAG TPA: FkbM family methyltransferase [Nitrospira sp.]|nr:FkbM family methyltransferase [Nitrospira sp.]
MAPVAAFLYRLNHASIWHRSIRVWGFSLRGTSLDRLLALALHRLGMMGTAERHLMEERVRPGMRIVDIGANVGLYSTLLARLVGPNGHVHAFEPEPSLFRALQGNLQMNNLGNLTAVNAALGDRSGTTTLYRSPFNTGDNRLGGLGQLGQRIDVQILRLDDALPFPSVDFIKMDVQGYEMAVFEGMEGVLRANAQLEILFEFWPSGLHAAGTDPAALLDHLFQRQFRVFAPEGKGLWPVIDFASWASRFKGRKYTNLLATRNI